MSTTRWQQRLGLVEYAVEDTPLVPDDWGDEAVPLSSLVRGTGSEPSRLVLFRRPIEHRADSREELEALVLTVVVEQVAELLGIDAEDVDPRYRATTVGQEARSRCAVVRPTALESGPSTLSRSSSRRRRGRRSG